MNPARQNLTLPAVGIQKQRSEATTLEIAPERMVSQIQSLLQPLVSNFEKSPLENGRKMRDLMNRNGTAFALAAARVFGNSNDERGCRYLVTVLWTHNLLIPLLSNAAIPPSIGVSLAQAAAKLDPQFHFRLSSFLQLGMDRDAMSGEAVTRLLEMLSWTMDPVAMAPLLKKILLHPDARVRSKATLLMGRGRCGIAAIQELLADIDPRVRANALEALWANPDSRVVPIFLAALSDESNRARGNAVLGLHMAGSTKAIGAALELARHPSPLYRATGAWVMGKTGDPRFLPHLGKLLGESEGPLRKAVFLALQASQKSASARNPTLTLRVFGSYVDASRAYVHLTVSDAASDSSTPISPNGFVITDGTQVVNEFSCTAKSSDRLLVAFVAPSFHPPDPLNQAVLQMMDKALTNKPDQEQWGVRQYSEASNIVQPSTGASFTADQALLRSKLKADDSDQKSLKNVFETIGELLEDSRNSIETCHFIVILNSLCTPDEEVERSLTPRAAAGNASFHFLSAVPNPPIERLCASLSGSFQVFESADTLGAEIQILYDALRFHYALEFETLRKSSSQSVLIQAYNSSSSGSCQIPCLN